MFILEQAVGKDCPNGPNDVKIVHQRLMAISKIPCYAFIGSLDDTIMEGIIEVQRHFMRIPDGVISVGGRTSAFLANWKNKPISPGVQLPGRLREAWD